jgi:hypothetical protein
MRWTCSRDISVHHWQRKPPSTGIAMPVTQPTSSLASIMAIRATSDAVPTPLRGWTASICWRYSGVDANSEEVIGVAVTGHDLCQHAQSGLDERHVLHPGQIAFTRMRWGAQSKAAALVKPSTACFDAQYATRSKSVSGTETVKRCLSNTLPFPGTAVWPYILERFTTQPRSPFGSGSCRIIWAVAARQQFMTPVAFTPMVVVQFESGIAQMGCGFLISGATPAAFTILVIVLAILVNTLNDTVTHISSLPYVSTARATRALVLAASQTSVLWNRPRPPSHTIRSTVEAKGCPVGSRSATTTRAPSFAYAIAMACPIPFEPPVMIATRSWRRPGLR